MTEDDAQRLARIEARLAAIEERNRRVEIHKTWETSAARKLSVVLLTYLVMCLVLTVVGTRPAWTHAIVPTLGFFLSTLSLPLIRGIWERRVLRQRSEASQPQEG